MSAFEMPRSPSSPLQVDRHKRLSSSYCLRQVVLESGRGSARALISTMLKASRVTRETVGLGVSPAADTHSWERLQPEKTKINTSREPILGIPLVSANMGLVHPKTKPFVQTPLLLLLPSVMNWFVWFGLTVILNCTCNVIHG